MAKIRLTDVNVIIITVETSATVLRVCVKKGRKFVSIFVRTKLYIGVSRNLFGTQFPGLYISVPRKNKIKPGRNNEVRERPNTVRTSLPRILKSVICNMRTYIRVTIYSQTMMGALARAHLYTYIASAALLSFGGRNNDAH